MSPPLFNICLFVKMWSRNTNFFSSDAYFGTQMVTILVGSGKEKFTLYKNALTAITNNLFCVLFASDLLETNTDTATAERGQAVLPEELPETIRAFMMWLYPAFMGLSLCSLPPCSETVTLFQLYGFGHKYLIYNLEDAIVSVLYEKFANDIDLWFTLGSNKLALEAFLKAVPSETHLYRLVVRSLAYSVRLRSKDPWSETRYAGILDSPTFSNTPATESQVEEVMESVPSQLWGPIFKEVLLMKTLGDRSRAFCSTVGGERDFLKRCEGLVNRR